MVFGAKSSSKTKLFEQPLHKLFNPKAINTLPEPIRCLLHQLYLRGPSTVGIFRKSPNAKHCRDLRQKLESHGQSATIEQFQVNVIASVFKEWLRSLPDCLLMSRLYPQWIDVAKLIERQEPPRECIRVIRQLLDRLNEPNLTLLQALICVLWHIANNSQHNMMSALNLGVCVGQSLLNDEHQHKSHRQPLGHSLSSSSASSASSPTSALFSFSAATFARRHRRARSQSILPTALSMSSLSQLQSSTSTNHLNSAQETAKYVPILVAFMIDNARDLFGEQILGLFGPPAALHAIDEPELEIKATGERQQQSDDSMIGILANNDDIDESSSASPRLSKQQQQQQQQQSDLMGSEDELVGVNSIKMAPVEPSSASAVSSTTSPYTDVCDADTTRAEVTTTPRQQRPLSATESTGSSSSASSSTSGLHSESPAFSSEPDSHDGCCVSSSYDLLPSYRMPKIPFQYTTSCYGGEAVLYYPSYAHWKHQQQQQQQQLQQQQQQQQQQPQQQQQHHHHQQQQSQLHHHHRQQQQQQHERANYQLDAERKGGVECHHQRHSLPCNNQLKQYNYHQQQQFRQHPQYPHQQQQQQHQPQRSNVMLLRDYYLSLEQQNKQFNSYRVERHQQRQQLLSHHQQQQQLLTHHRRQQQLLSRHQQQQQLLAHQQQQQHQQQHLLPHHQQQRQHLLTHYHQHHHPPQQHQPQQRAATLHWSAH